MTARSLVAGVACAAVTACSSGEGIELPRTVIDDPSLPRLEVGGLLFHGETHGDPARPTIIVVHGGPGADYRALLPLQALEDAFFVVFYDQQGTGLSPRVPAEDLSFENALDDLGAFVETFSADRPVHLIGHSFGGQLVSTWAGRHPDRVGRLVLAEPGPLNEEMAQDGPVRGMTFDTFWAGMEANMAAQQVVGPDADAQADYAIGQIMLAANPGYWCDQTPPDSAQGWRFGKTAWEAITASLFDDQGRQIDMVEGVAGLTEPVLFLASSCNTVIGEAFQRRQMELFDDASLVVIEDAGHELFSEQPTASLDAVRAHLTP